MEYLVGLILIAVSVIYSVCYVFFKKYPFVNVGEILEQYKNIFNKSKSDFYAFIFIPLFSSVGVTLSFSLNVDTVELICTTVSILLGLLFATLGVLASITPQSIHDKDAQQDPALKERRTRYRRVYDQTVQLILYLGFLSIVELICVFAAIIVSSNSCKIPDEMYKGMEVLGSVIVYYLAFSILLNCLIVLKRISTIIAERDQ